MVKFFNILIGFILVSVATVLALNEFYWTATRIGSVKDSGSFTPANCLNLNNINDDVYSNTRTIGQVGIGDILYTDAAGTIPLNGGSKWWAFKITDGGSNNVRGYKIDGSGVVIDVTILSGHFAAFAYLSTTLTSNCANGNCITATYAAEDDPEMYLNKKVFSSTGGAGVANGSYTASYKLSGPSTWTFSTSSGATKIESLACCISNPVSEAGPDAVYTMLAAQVPLNGFGLDCGGTVTYGWSRISGPNTPTINDASAAITYLTGFITGTYVYRLTVTDNSANVTTDDVTITVYPIPLVINPVKISVNVDQVYGMEGEDYRGVYGSSWNYYDAGTCDPLNGSAPTGKYDFDSVAAGWQLKQSSGAVQRLTHDFFRADLPLQYRGRGVLTEFDTVKYITKIYIYDTTNAAGHTIKFFIGNKTKARQARWQQEFGDISPDYTYTTTATPHWDSLALSGQDSGQYVYTVFSNFAIKVAIVLYGGTSTYNTSDTSIIRRRYTDYTDTAGAITDLHGINNEGALPLNNAHFPKDSLPYYTNGMRFYNAAVGSGSMVGISGLLDPDITLWTTVAGSTNQIDIGPFGTGVGAGNPYIIDSTVHRVDGVQILQNVRGANGYYINESGYNPEFKPKNDKTSNVRSRKAWERYTYALECLVAKFYGNTSPANPSKYRYKNDRWPGQFGLGFFGNIIEMDNEKDEGFRSFPADSIYMRPEELMFAASIIYDTLKALQPSLTILTQAFVAGNELSVIRPTIKNAYLYYGNRRTFCDGLSIHDLISELLFDHVPTSAELCGQHGAFPGTHNVRQTTQDEIQYLDREFGKHIPWHITEWGYTKDSIGPTDCSGFTDAGYSLIGAPQIKSHTKYENQAIVIWQALVHYAGVKGVKTANYYTNKDNINVDSTNCPGLICDKNGDATNGITNYINVPRLLHPSYWYSQSFVKRFGNYKFDSNISNVAGGVFVDKWVCRSNTDSVIYIVFNQGRNDAGGTTTLPINRAPSCTKWQLSFSSFNMTSSSQSVTGANIVVTARPEGDVYSFFDPNQTWYYLFGNKKIKP